MKNKPAMVLALLLIGCNKEHPHTDPATVCRASPTTITYKGSSITDNMQILTGESQNTDGVHEAITLCKGTVCETAEASGATADGVTIQFIDRFINVYLAKTNGYDYLQAKLDYTCHGG